MCDGATVSVERLLYYFFRYFTFGKENGDPTAFRFVHRAIGQNLRKRNEPKLIFLSALGHLFEFFLHIGTVSQLIHELHLHRFLSKTEHFAFVGKHFHGIHCRLARLCNIGCDLVPKPVYVCGDLFAIGIAHPVEHEWLYGCLVGAYLEDLHLHAEFVEGIFVEHCLGRNPDKPQHSFRIEVEFVCNTGEVVTLLGVSVGIGYDELARHLEILQRATQFLCRCHTDGKVVQIEEDTGYVGIIFGLADGFDCL